MKSNKSPPELSLKIKKIQTIIKDLEKLKNIQEAETISQLLEIMVSLFEEVDRQLKKLEKKPTTK